MSSPPLKRRLVTILASDAVGYSRMMSDAEEETLRVLAAHRAVIDGIIQFHDGRIINTAGDSVLAEFVSPVQAVRCAVEIQDALKTRNDALPESRRLQFRIGINLGDVIVKGDDLLGDGVNVAARLESIAEPGGICISSSVYDQISGKLDLKLSDIGEQSLKNIARPIRTYRIQSASGRAPARAASPEGRRSFARAAALATVAVVAAGGWLYLEHAAERERAAAAAEAARMRAEADAARARLEADSARAKANADAARARAELDALRAKAAADAARTKAQADDARAKAELDAMRARAQAEADALRAKAQAEADAARIRAQAEAAVASVREEVQRSAAAVVPVAAAPALAASTAVSAAPDPTRYDGAWRLSLACPAFEGGPARESTVLAKVDAGKVAAEFGAEGNPGFFRMRGQVQYDDTLLLRGAGIAGGRQHRGRPFRIAIPGRFADSRYKGEGKFGARTCAVTMAR